MINLFKTNQVFRHISLTLILLFIPFLDGFTQEEHPFKLTKSEMINGVWFSNTGLVYEISGDSSHSWWFVASIPQIGIIKWDNENLKGEWIGPEGKGTMSGQIVDTSDGGKALTIHWDTGIELFRPESRPSAFDELFSGNRGPQSSDEFWLSVASKKVLEKLPSDWLQAVADFDKECDEMFVIDDDERELCKHQALAKLMADVINCKWRKILSKCSSKGAVEKYKSCLKMMDMLD